MHRLRSLAYGISALVIFLSAAALTTAIVALPAPLARRRRICQRAIRWALATAGIRVHIRGRERVPEGSAIVVCNHASILDGLILFSRLPDHFTFVVRAESRRTPLFGYMLDRSGVIWLTRGEARSGAAMLRRLLTELQDGTAVTMFPEGTIGTQPGLQRFKPGAFLLAAKAGCPVVPAVIRGTRDVYADGDKLPSRHPVDVQFLQPQYAAGDAREHASALQDAVRATILAHCGEADLAPATP